MLLELPERVWDQLDVGDCWEWTGACFSNGYGAVGFGGRQWRVHRLVWTALVGDIPAGLTIDHLCQNKRCCNPDHLEPVTQAENNRRSPWRNNWRRTQPAPTHCPCGREYTPENTYAQPRPSGSGDSKVCRACVRRRVREYRQRKRRESL